MSDTSPENRKVFSFTSIPLRGSKIKRPMKFAMLPDTFLPFLAQIAVMWGVFENYFEDFLLALLTATGNEPKGWQYFRFDQKRDLFRKRARIQFECQPMILLGLFEILSDSVALQIKRNVLVHGRIIIRIETDENVNGIVTLIANGYHKRQPITEHFTKDGLEDLFYDLGHLSGRMWAFSAPWDFSVLQQLSLQDRFVLRAFLLKNYPRHSMPAIQARPPAPSQA